MSKINKLADLLTEEYKDFGQRNSAIGGSEVNIFYPFDWEKIMYGKTLNTKLLEKTAIVDKKNFYSEHTSRGLFLESSAIAVLEKTCKVKIFGGDVFRNLRSSKDPFYSTFCYYPDGIFLDESGALCIAEIKCPAIAKSDTLQSIKREYKEQISLGLEIIRSTGIEESPKTYFLECEFQNITMTEFFERSESYLYGFVLVKDYKKGKSNKYNSAYTYNDIVQGGSSWETNKDFIVGQHSCKFSSIEEMDEISKDYDIVVFWKLPDYNLHVVERNTLVEWEKDNTYNKNFGDSRIRPVIPVETRNAAKVFKLILQDLDFKNKFSGVAGSRVWFEASLEELNRLIGSKDIKEETYLENYTEVIEHMNKFTDKISKWSNLDFIYYYKSK